MTKLEKPEITKVMMVSCISKGKGKYAKMDKEHFVFKENFKNGSEKLTNFILPLSNVEIYQYEMHSEIHVKFTKANMSKVKKKYSRIAISFTNDPRCNHAVDYSDMGCARLVYKLWEVETYLKGLNTVIFRSKGNVIREFTVPDRVRWFQ